MGTALHADIGAEQFVITGNNSFVWTWIHRDVEIYPSFVE